MGKGYRQGRLGEEIRRIISGMLLHQIKDPRLSSMISISGVEVTADGSYATCYVSTLDMSKSPEEKEAHEKEILAGLASASGLMRNEIGKTGTHAPDPAAYFQDGPFHGIRRAYRQDPGFHGF